MKGCTFNTANLPVCLIDFNYTRDTNTAKFYSYFRHFGESVIFVFRQTKSKFAHGEWRSLSANPVLVGAQKLSSRMPDSQSRDPGFEYPFYYSFEVWAFSFSPRRLNPLSCINEYLAIDSGENVSD